jgi:hypothetical protein
MGQTTKGGKKGRKIGRSKRPKDQNTSAFVRGLMTVEAYMKSQGFTNHINYARKYCNVS